MHTLSVDAELHSTLYAKGLFSKSIGKLILTLMSSNLRLASRRLRISDWFVLRGELVANGIYSVDAYLWYTFPSIPRQLWTRLNMPNRGKSLKQRAREMAEERERKTPGQRLCGKKKGE